MESLAANMKVLIAKVLEKKGDCPNCKEPLYAWKTKNPDGTERCPPTCMSCGFTDLKRKEDVMTEKIYNNSLKARAWNFFRNGSMVTNESLFDKDFKTFKVENDETKLALEKSHAFVNEILLGKTTHLVLSGKSGVGKSHLSMSICKEVIKRSNYDKKCLFINYRELLEQLKKAFNDDVMYKLLHQSLMADIKTTDLVVIDDLGAELGGSSANNSSNYNNDTLHSIMEAREDKALVVNTNLTGKELKAVYGERIVSRIMNNSNGFISSLNQTKDKRITGTGV